MKIIFPDIVKCADELTFSFRLCVWGTKSARVFPVDSASFAKQHDHYFYSELFGA